MRPLTILTLTCLALPALPCAAQSTGNHGRYQRPDVDYGDDVLHEDAGDIFDEQSDGGIPDVAGLSGVRPIFFLPEFDLGSRGGYIADHGVITRLRDARDLPDDQSSGEPMVWLIGVPARRDIDLGTTGGYVFDSSRFDAMGDNDLPDDQSAGDGSEPIVWLIGVPARRDIDLGTTGGYVFDSSRFDAMGDSDLPDDQSSGDGSDDSEPFVWFFEGDPFEVDVPDPLGDQNPGPSSFFEPSHPDLNDDGSVDAADLVSLIQNWGACNAGEPCAGDLDQDGFVDAADLAILLFNWN